jgi:hypothetical protein
MGRPSRVVKDFSEAAPCGVGSHYSAKRGDGDKSRADRPLNAIVKGRRGVNADTALLFEALTRCHGQVCLTLQAKRDLCGTPCGPKGRPKVRALSRTA